MINDRYTDSILSYGNAEGNDNQYNTSNEAQTEDFDDLESPEALIHDIAIGNNEKCCSEPAHHSSDCNRHACSGSCASDHCKNALKRFLEGSHPLDNVCSPGHPCLTHYITSLHDTIKGLMGEFGYERIPPVATSREALLYWPLLDAYVVGKTKQWSADNWQKLDSLVEYLYAAKRSNFYETGHVGIKKVFDKIFRKGGSAPEAKDPTKGWSNKKRLDGLTALGKFMSTHLQLSKEEVELVVPYARHLLIQCAGVDIVQKAAKDLGCVGMPNKEVLGRTVELFSHIDPKGKITYDSGDGGMAAHIAMLSVGVVIALLERELSRVTISPFSSPFSREAATERDLIDQVVSPGAVTRGLDIIPAMTEDELDHLTILIKGIMVDRNRPLSTKETRELSTLAKTWFYPAVKLLRKTDFWAKIEAARGTPAVSTFHLPSIAKFLATKSFILHSSDEIKLFYYGAGEIWKAVKPERPRAKEAAVDLGSSSSLPPPVSTEAQPMLTAGDDEMVPAEAPNVTGSEEGASGGVYDTTREAGGGDFSQSSADLHVARLSDSISDLTISEKPREGGVIDAPISLSVETVADGSRPSLTDDVEPLLSTRGDVGTDGVAATPPTTPDTEPQKTKRSLYDYDAPPLVDSALVSKVRIMEGKIEENYRKKLKRGETTDPLPFDATMYLDVLSKIYNFKKTIEALDAGDRTNKAVDKAFLEAEEKAKANGTATEIEYIPLKAKLRIQMTNVLEFLKTQKRSIERELAKYLGSTPTTHPPTTPLPH